MPASDRLPAKAARIARPYSASRPRPHSPPLAGPTEPGAPPSGATGLLVPMLFVARRRPSCGGRTTAISGVATSSGERSCASLARTSGAFDRSPPLQVRLKRCAYHCLSPTRHGRRLRTTTIPNADGYFFARPNSRLAVAQPLLTAIDQKTIVIAVLRRRQMAS